MQCDEIFQEIQRLEEQKQRAQRARAVLSEVITPASTPYDDWVNDADNREAAAARCALANDRSLLVQKVSPPILGRS